MIPQNVSDLIAENERLKADVAHLEFCWEKTHKACERAFELAEKRRSLLEADAKRWETLCALMDMGSIDIVYDFSHRGFSARFDKFVRLKGTPQEITPEALKAWLDKEAE